MFDRPSTKAIEAIDQACPAGGKLAEINSSEIGFGTSVAFLRDSGGASFIFLREPHSTL
jgi:hypothetical protein